MPFESVTKSQYKLYSVVLASLRLEFVGIQVEEYLGLPYAEPPTGLQRFCDPVMFTKYYTGFAIFIFIIITITFQVHFYFYINLNYKFSLFLKKRLEKKTTDSQCN